MSRDLTSVVAATWPWGPPGAALPDVVLAYCAVLIIVLMVTWKAASASGRSGA